MWILFALCSAVCSAGVSFSLKRAVAHGGAVLSTVAFRAVAGVLLVVAVTALGMWRAPTPEYWRAVAMVMVPEVLGMLFLTLALRAGELSMVQPLSGLIPPLVMLGGFLFLGEVPSLPAAAGVALVTAGVYCIGLRPGASAMEPIRALARSRASWYMVASVCAWSLATLVHRVGVQAVGALPWAVTLALGSALGLAVALPFLAWKSGDVGLPEDTRQWGRAVLLAGVAYALMQAALQTAFGMAQAGYVAAVSSISILIATLLGIVVLRERSAARTRAAGAVLVCGGAAMIAAFG
jgi:drug/metabolite transporter (DMT)-like permease